MMKLLEQHCCYGGVINVFEHHSDALSCIMQFSVFLPPQASEQSVPVLTYLSGLTCTHANFTTKAGAYGFAAREGIAIVAPDTSPRGDAVPDDPAYDFGQGAGFYLNATQAPWSTHFQMEDYIVDELNALICNEFPVLDKQQGIMGHSMGGHGALTLGLKYPQLFKSISAFAPIVAPAQVPWGQKALAGYLGDDQTAWQKHDACALMRAAGDRSTFPEILIDQGTEDGFLTEQLKPELFQATCGQVGQKLRLNWREGYDHSYYFIQSFIEEHLVHHARILRT